MLAIQGDLYLEVVSLSGMDETVGIFIVSVYTLEDLEDLADCVPNLLITVGIPITLVPESNWAGLCGVRSLAKLLEIQTPSPSG